MGEHVQSGLVALCSVREYEDNLIKKHESPARQGRRPHPARHEQTPTPSRSFLTLPGAVEIDASEGCLPRLSLYDITTPDGIGHKVWKIAAPEVISKLVRTVRRR